MVFFPNDSESNFMKNNSNSYGLDFVVISDILDDNGSLGSKEYYEGLSSDSLRLF